MCIKFVLLWLELLLIRHMALGKIDGHQLKKPGITSTYYDDDYTYLYGNDEEIISDVSLSSNRRNITKKDLLRYFQDISISNQTISGIFVDHTDSGKDNEFKTINRITGVFPGIVTHMMGSYEHTPARWQSFTDDVIADWNNGFLVHIEWIFWDKAITLNNNFNPTSNKTYDHLKWKDLTEDGGTLNKEWKNLLDNVAPYLQQMQNAGVVPVCGLVLYINVRYNYKGIPGANRSLKLFQITRDYMTTRHNLHSLVWTWSISCSRIGSVSELKNYWPGNEYVDVVSLNYERSSPLSLSEYQELLDVIGNKPVSMERMRFAPTLQLLHQQPRWTWFTVKNSVLTNMPGNTLNSTFNSPMVLNKQNIKVLFKQPNFTMVSRGVLECTRIIHNILFVQLSFCAIICFAFRNFSF